MYSCLCFSCPELPRRTNDQRVSRVGNGGESRLLMETLIRLLTWCQGFRIPAGLVFRSNGPLR